MIKKSETGIGTALDWTGFRESYMWWILINLSCYGMLCELPELGLDEIGLHWDCIGLDAIRYDTIRHDTTQYMYVCINTYE